MGIGKYLPTIITGANKSLGDYLVKCTFRKNPKDFSRERKLGFKETVSFMLNMINKTLQLEIDNFVEKVLNMDMTITKQAYLAARQKIKPEIFMKLNDDINKIIYQEADDDGYKTWNGYRLSAIDGSVMEIPDTKELREEYGYIKNQNGQVARAKAACIYDVVNKIVIKSKIDRYTASEREMAKSLITELLPDKKENELILFDRGYPSSELMVYLFDNKIDFVMRAQRNYAKAVDNAKNEDQIIVQYNKKCYKVKVLKFMLDSGQEEILLTSLLDEKLTIKDFKNLYFKRWGIETKFDELKNRLEIENFTGTTKQAIEQDFYATIYISNMIELVRTHNDEKIRKKHSEKGLKYEYKTNLNTLTGALKDKFVIMLMENSPRKRNKMLKVIEKQIAKSIIPIRPGRQNRRMKRQVLSKYKANRKRCL